MERSRGSVEYEHLCAVLRALRHEAGLTQYDVAGRLGTPQSFVSKYESGERRLDVVELAHVADALGSSLAAVVERFEVARRG
ncbi:helix-turn-helix domain-containing protein [Jiangella sp. DSM 45060]|uniref:helix-turn-helix domain-containing protein n=1 Tax=Jiangella sp. DSM 45060 TaxID=1798224 RepID=UPI00087BFA2A|nr:helix-turn-helix transcriptional regulator [Jiangella sp. DSM 45060]SDT69377.1 Helix-turn-helix domain-containing protein [Jiangella sp. DSM 45060]